MENRRMGSYEIRNTKGFWASGLYRATMPLEERYPSLLKISVEGDFNILNRKIRIRARTDKLNKLLVTVIGFRQYTALSDLRLRAFAHGQEIGLPQVAIQETTFSRLEPGYGHIPIPTTSCAPLLVEVDATHIQRRALGATHRGSIAIRQRQEPLALFFHGMNQDQIAATQETYDEYLVSIKRTRSLRRGHR